MKEKIYIILNNIDDWINCCKQLDNEGYFWARSSDSYKDKYHKCKTFGNPENYIVIGHNEYDDNRLYYGSIYNDKEFDGIILYWDDDVDLESYFAGLKMGLL